MTAEEEVEELLAELTEYDDLESMLEEVGDEIELPEFEEGDAGTFDQNVVERD